MACEAATLEWNMDGRVPTASTWPLPVSFAKVRGVNGAHSFYLAITSELREGVYQI